MERTTEPQAPPAEPQGPVQWDRYHDLIMLSDLPPIIRTALPTIYRQLAQGKFPIAPLEHCKPYRFPKSRVRAWVEQGTVTNPAMKRTRAVKRGRRK
jgi:predicted DNA-binding transcriptional regulator AlpA